MINDKNREQMHIVVENMDSSIIKKLEYKTDKQTLPQL